MKALSIKQPWADLIVSGIKTVENRTWKTNFRGRIYVHASKTEAKPGPVLTIFSSDQIHSTKIPLGMYFSYNKSAIIGEVDIMDCVQNHQSVWAEKGVWNWVLANPVKYDKPILNVKGRLSFWKYNK